MRDFIYVANSKLDSVSVCSLEKVLSDIPVNAFPVHVCATPDMTELWVSNYKSDNISIIDTSTNTVSRTVSEVPAPLGIAFSSDGARAYIASDTKPDGALCEIDTKTRHRTARIRVGTGPTGVAVSPDNEWVLVTNYWSNDLSVIAAKKRKVALTINMCRRPRGVVFPRGQEHAFVTTNCGPNLLEPENWIAIIDPTKAQWQGTISVDDWPAWMTAGAEGRELYVTIGSGKLNQGAVALADVRTKQQTVSLLPLVGQISSESPRNSIIA